MSLNKIISSALKVLMQFTRLSIFTLLVKHGKYGMPLKIMQKNIAILRAMLSHHLAVFLLAGCNVRMIRAKCQHNHIIMLGI